jgi:glycosyltransferase involved in cell wall biosynthesis
MRVLWICGLPRVVQEEVLGGEDHGAQAAWSWVVAHLPPPSEVELHLACLWPGGNKRKTVDYKNSRIHLVPCPKRGRALLFFQRDTIYFRSLFEELRPEVVHGWGTEDSFGLVARRLAPQRHVVGIQGLIHAYRKHLAKSYRASFVRVSERVTLKKARSVVAESQYALDSAAPLCLLATKQVIEHPLRGEFLDSFSSDGNGKTVLFIGNIEERKGFADAITAFARVAPDNWTLHVIGKGTAEEETRMQKIVKNAAIGDRFYHSHDLDTKGLVKAMQSSSVFLLPSRVDTGPTALKEALTMGLWPVCYDNSGPGEYIRKYAFGSLVKDRDLSSLCGDLKRCLIDMPWRDPDKRIAAQRKARVDFSREKAWEQLLELYWTIVRRS